VLFEPALDGIAFAVLLLGAILGRDEFRRQRHDLGMAGRHDRRRQQTMIALDLPLARLRVRKCGHPSFREQKNSVPSQAIRVLPPSRPKACRIGGSASSVSRRSEAGLQQRGVRLVQNVADVTVGVDAADGEQGLAVGAATRFSQIKASGRIWYLSRNYLKIG
jgi:hypothetical protein